ncbi:MAG: response regulator [wastewater metagenome]|nr:response regulator [Candidatus Loosdrechtia aerotolerans]
MEGPQILIIDDEVDMCWALENIITLRGYRVCSATSGKEGVALMKQLYQNVRLIFLDVKLPDMDGIELANLIKECCSKVKIAIISGYYYRDSEAIWQGFARGLFDSFVGKPFSISEIRSAIEFSFLS